MIECIKDNIIKYLKEKGEKDTSKFTIEMSNNILNGQLTTNVLMTYSKVAQKEELIILIEKIPLVHKVIYANPGFLNIFFDESLLGNIENTWKSVQVKKNINISVEYASPNPTGPCHIGHARGSIMGDIISSILMYLGYNVRKDCIFNDGGKQVEKFIESIYIRYKELQNQATATELENIFYKGEYVKDLAKAYIDNKNLTLKSFMHNKDKIMEIMKNSMKEDLKLLQIEHDTITHESKLEEEKNICWQELEQKGLLEFEQCPNNQRKIFFKSKDFEDDKDRVIEREDGTITYFGNDIAYHWKKKYKLSEEEYNEQIIVLGDDHVGYLKRLLGAVSNFSINLRILTHNLVKIIKNNVEVKMSKRNGNFITIRDFIHHYGNSDILRILMIEQGSKSVVNLDLNKLNIEDSSLFYIQYAYTRLSSILSKNIPIHEPIHYSLLTENDEKLLISYLIYWPELIKKIGKTLDVHHLFVYLQGFTKVIHSYLSNYKILNEDLPLEMHARLYLVEKCKNLLLIIFKILKITPLEKM